MAIGGAPLPLVATLAAWAAVGVGMALGRERGGRQAARCDPRARVGLAIQALAFAIVFTPWRPTAGPGGFDLGLSWAGAALAWAAAGFAIRAAHVLGRQWSLEARLLPEHRLVREGPYRHVRHPIYAAMLGLLVATGLELASWPALAAAVALYVFGTLLRTRVEEDLLRERFGDEYSRYAAEVPALVPRPRSRPRAPRADR